jgi:hypothetical protein
MSTITLALGILLSVRLDANPNRKEPTLVIVNRVVERLLPKILAQTESPRITGGSGLIGLGTFRPAGYFDSGWGSVPLKVSPSAGFGTSVNLNVVTGRLY